MNGNIREGANIYVDGNSGGPSQMNGELLNDGGLNSVPNGRPSASSWDYKSSRNGSLLSVNGGVNGLPENGRRSPAPLQQNGKPTLSNGDGSSVTSTNANTQDTPIESAPKPNMNGESETSRKIQVPHPISTNPQSTGPLTYTSSLMPTTPSAPATPSKANTTSPHRFSSPPSYPANSNLSPSTSHPGLVQLQHRHTLQVPKVVPGRSSREGDDAAYSSGRFSPTSGARRGSLSFNRRNTQSLHSNIPHEEILPDEDAMRWAEAVKQKRASKRRRKDEEDDDRVVVGTKVDQNHVNWVTAYNMLTGIRFTVSRTNAKLDRELTDADFDAKHKFSFDM